MDDDGYLRSLCTCAPSQTKGRTLQSLLQHCFNLGAVNLFRVMMWCHLAVWRAGEAWPRSEHTGSLLPDMLRGKSPCLGAESATGRPEDLGTRAISEAQVELWFWCFGPLQQQSHAVSVCKNANRTGLTLSMPSSNRCLAEAHFKPCFLDSQLSKSNNQETDCAIHN